jgi:FMN phosphatase YigB (HAD superfamily)
MLTPLLSYLLEPQTAVVFDIDGVLAPYEFGELSHSACADDEWEAFVREHDPYGHLRPIRLLQDFIAQKGTERVYACSVAADFEEAGKRDFVLREYGLPTDHVRIVSAKADKLAYLEEVRSQLGVPAQRVALVEDTVGTLYLVSEQTGFTTVHVSSLFAYGE